MSPISRHRSPVTTNLAGSLALLSATVPVQAHESGAPHLIHAYEGWVALAVVVLSLLAAGVLIRRALRR